MPEEMLTLFDACRAATPGAVAVVDDRSSRTYTELAAESDGYAHELWRNGIGAEAVVAVVAERDPRYVGMTLGVLRSGAAFLPIEPSTPVARARRMCATAGVRALLVQPGHERYARQVADGLDPAPTIIAAVPSAPDAVPDAPRRHPGALAYVIFTSGSTGVPKGAMVTHGGMANHIAAKVLDLDLGPADVVGLTAPLSFDISVWQALAALAVGGGVSVASPVNLSEPAELVAWVRRHRVTVLEVVPSFLAVLVDELMADEWLRAGLGSLRYLIATGEALPGELVGRWYRCCPGIAMVNAYGPTECSDDVTHHLVSAADASGARPPIGREILNTRVYVVDDQGRETNQGVEGELLVGGHGVGRGYIADPVRTALAFVPDHLSGASGERLYRTGDRGSRAPDGAISYLGRRDRQVKVRGHRIELGDVEAELLRIPGIASAASVLSGDRLRCYVTLRPGTDLADSDHVLRLFRESAPAYFVPHELTILDRMPISTNGKLDHQALAKRGRPGGHAETDGREPLLDEVRAAVAEALEVSAVGADDDFFAAGGDSLRAMTLVSAARKRFGAGNASLSGFLAEPTPRGLLAVLAAARSAPAPERTEPAAGALSSGQERLWFLEQLRRHRDPQLIRLELTLRGHLDVRALRHALAAVVIRHEPLRSVFSQNGGVPVRSVWPTAEVTLEEVGADDAVPDLMAGSGLSARTGHPPLMAARLTGFGPDHHVLTLVIHHLVADGWSLAVLGREITTYYRRWCEGDREVPVPEYTYAHYVEAERRWLGGTEAEETERYWTGQLAGAPPVIDLPLDRQRRASPDLTAHHVVHELGRDETSAVAATARAVRATPFMAVLAACYAVLRDLTATDDLVLGIDSVNRSWPGSEGLIGTFVNQLPVRLRCPAAAPTFRDLLELVRRQCLGAYEHDRLPFHRIVAAVNPPRRAGRFPLFQVKVTQQGGWRANLTLPGVIVEPSDIAEPMTDLDLMLDVSGEASRLRLELVYRPEVLDGGTAAAWVDAIGAVLRAGAVNPHEEVLAMNAPRTPTEETVAAILCDLLQLDAVDVSEDFFALGGHSMLAVRLVHQLAERTGVELSLETFFELGTVAEVAAELDRCRSHVPDLDGRGIREGEL